MRGEGGDRKSFSREKERKRGEGGSRRYPPSPLRQLINDLPLLGLAGGGGGCLDGEGKNSPIVASFERRQSDENQMDDLARGRREVTPLRSAETHA